MSSKAGSKPDGKPLAGGKPSSKSAQKAEQLERARAEQLAAAARLAEKKREQEPKPEESKENKEADAADQVQENDSGKLAAQAEKPGSGVWLCMRCGTQGCGGGKHSRQHYLQPRSDLHCLVLNTETWVIWCYECSSEVFVDSHKKLYETVEVVRKIKTKPNKQVKSQAVSSGGPKLASKDFKDQANSALAAGALAKVKGLNNLGNTCFFNSVMQCLSQTHNLTRLIDIQCNKGVPFTVPSVACRLSDNTDNESDPDGTADSRGESSDDDDGGGGGGGDLGELNLQLTDGGPMVTSLAAFFKEMHSGSKACSSISPGHLFGQVVKRSPQFRGFQQQDSHELLRHLMEGLRNEEAKRQKCAILKSFGLSERTDPKTVANKTRKKLKAYGRYGSHTLLDKLFSGQMVSTIVCEECKHSSQIYEQFLDLSLPVIEDKPHKPSKKGAANAVADDEENSVSCFGTNSIKNSRKEKAKLKKQKGKGKGKRHKKGSERLVEEDDDDETEKKIKAELNESKEKEEDKEIILEKSSIEEPKVTLESKSSNEKSPEETVKIETPNGAESKTASTDKSKNVLSNNFTSTKVGIFEKTKNESKTREKKVWKDEFDDEEEEEGYEEGDDGDWEWDYGEQWEEEGNKGNDTDSKAEEVSEYIDVGKPEEKPETGAEKKPLVSLNPLPPESLVFSERERSSEPAGGAEETDDETGASSNGDIEDNNDLEDEKKRSHSISSRHEEALFRKLEDLTILDPLKINNDKFDPHMQELCQGISSLAAAGQEAANSESGQYQTAESEPAAAAAAEADRRKETSKQRERLKHEWTARTLTSLAPRYQTAPGECSVYSCLNQFTQSELLTGPNKWACDRCTRMAKDKLCNGEHSDSSQATGDQAAKPKVVYSNASKQLLIFAPPAILTLHLKRFQQTMSGCRKVNKHVAFPLQIDLAPFCSSTCVATPTVAAGQRKMPYALYGAVEHSGRLQGGHYTAYVKVRPSLVLHDRDAGAYFSPPLSKASDIPSFLEEIQKKFSRLADQQNPETDSGENSESAFLSQPKKWYYVSDAHVTEVSEEKVLKCQAYLLFYERIL